MELPWYARRFVGAILGLVVALTFSAVWGPPFVRTMAWLAGMSAEEPVWGTPWYTLPGMVLGGLLCSLPAAAIGAVWLLGDSAERTGRDRDQGHARPLGAGTLRRVGAIRHGGWLLILGLLVGMMFSAPGLFEDWSYGLRRMVEGAAPTLDPIAPIAVAAMVQSFPFATVLLFLWTLTCLFLPQRWQRWPGSGGWVPWRALAVGAVLWLAAVLVAVLPAYLELA